MRPRLTHTKCYAGVPSARGLLASDGFESVRAIAESPTNYDTWCAAMQRLNDQAIDDRLRGMALAEVRMLTGIPTEPDQSPRQGAT